MSYGLNVEMHKQVSRCLVYMCCVMMHTNVLIWLNEIKTQRYIRKSNSFIPVKCVPSVWFYEYTAGLYI